MANNSSTNEAFATSFTSRYCREYQTIHWCQR